ncbi:MAG: cupin domain-containing protein [Xanthobacteraceae bacterium]
MLDPIVKVSETLQRPGNVAVEILDISSSVTPHVGASRMTLPPNATSKLDLHDAEEIWFVGSGNGEFHLEDEVFKVAAPQVLAIPKRHKHQIINTGQSALVIYSIWWPVG